MLSTLSRRAFLAGATATAMTGQVAANAPLTSLRPAARAADLLRGSQPPAEALIRAAKLGGQVAFSVAESASGHVLEEHGAALGLPPASVAKALTAAYALETLGPAHHFATEVIATGEIGASGIVDGDLILAGGGDPTLDTNALADLAQALKTAGIREIRGRFLVWGGALPYAASIDVDQPAHVGYSPAVSGLNLNFNRVHFEWRRSANGYAVTMDARSDRYRPDVTVARMQVAARSTPVYVYEDAGARDNWSVARGALGKGGARWLPVRKPELYAGEVFQTFARAQGIVLKAPEVTELAPRGRVLARHESPALRIVLRDMLKYSTNLTAEAVGMAATAARIGRRPDDLGHSAAEMSRWAQASFGLGNVALVDHSGLGDRSRIAASDMTKALVAVRQRMGIKPLLKVFQMRDDERRVMADHPVKVHAKTGTLNFVSGLAGFADLPDGTELAFAIFAADTDRRAALSRAERERPPGARSWNSRAKTLQQKLIERWAVLYGA